MRIKRVDPERGTVTKRRTWRVPSWVVITERASAIRRNIRKELEEKWVGNKIELRAELTYLAVKTMSPVLILQRFLVYAKLHTLLQEWKSGCKKKAKQSGERQLVTKGLDERNNVELTRQRKSRWDSVAKLKSITIPLNSAQLECLRYYNLCLSIEMALWKSQSESWDRWDF